MPNTIALLQELFKRATDNEDKWARKSANTGIFGDNYEEDRLPPHMAYNGPDLPPVSRAPMFRPQTEVRGGQNFANYVEDFFNKVPEMRGRAKMIQHGPTLGSINELGESGLNPLDFNDTNLNGIYSRSRNEIGINPALVDNGWEFSDGSGDRYFSLPRTIAHEMGHAGGMGHGPMMKLVEAIAEGGDPRLKQPALHALDTPWDTLPTIAAGPAKTAAPEPLDPSAMPADMERLQNLQMQLGELNRKRHQSGMTHLVNEGMYPTPHK